MYNMKLNFDTLTDINVWTELKNSYKINDEMIDTMNFNFFVKHLM